jgi:hypothetical protein
MLWSGFVYTHWICLLEHHDLVAAAAFKAKVTSQSPNDPEKWRVDVAGGQLR